MFQQCSMLTWFSCIVLRKINAKCLHYLNISSQMSTSIYLILIIFGGNFILYEIKLKVSRKRCHTCVVSLLRCHIIQKISSTKIFQYFLNSRAFLTMSNYFSFCVRYFQRDHDKEQKYSNDFNLSAMRVLQQSHVTHFPYV